MAILLGDAAPNFQNVETSQGPIADFYQWASDSWVVLFSHPKDFTPVCTTELGYMAKIKSEFDKRKVKILAVSVDPLSNHQKWIKDIEETQHCTLNYPIIADSERKVANLYHMIHPNELNDLTVRSVFVIDPNKKVRLMITYPASTGRNFDEILRTIDSLQLTTQYKLATPVNWKYGEDCIVVPSVSDEEAKKLFPEYKTIKPYLRVTKQPA